MKATSQRKIVTLAILFAATSALYWACGSSPKPCPNNTGTAPPAAGVAERPVDYAVNISGLVRQPVSLTRMDLQSFQSVTVKLNDVRSDGSFRGVFRLRGVPLRTLLEMAHISKESSVFNRDMDIAIVVRGASGEATVFSWGEVYYRNRSEIILAYDSTGLLPHKECAACHEKETYEPWRNQVLRKVPYPKLVATGDYFSDRSVEAVTSIEVVELGVDRGFQVARQDAPDDYRSPTIKVTDSDGKVRELIDLPELPRLEAQVIQAGDGTGFHGVRDCEGVSLKAVLEGLGYGPDSTSGFVFTARDGYRVFLSSGEIFLAPTGKDILLAEVMNGTKLTDSGRYQLVPVSDDSADRWLRAVATIDMVKYEPEPELLVVGMGPGDTSLMTLEAVSAIARADVLVYVGKNL